MSRKSLSTEASVRQHDVLACLLTPCGHSTLVTDTIACRSVSVRSKTLVPHRLDDPCTRFGKPVWQGEFFFHSQLLLRPFLAI